MKKVNNTTKTILHRLLYDFVKQQSKELDICETKLCIKPPYILEDKYIDVFKVSEDDRVTFVHSVKFDSN
jgi:hypothetical protein